MKLPWKVIIPAVVVLVVVILILVCHRRLGLLLRQMITPESRGVALSDLPNLYSSEITMLGQVVIKTYGEYRANAIWWSAVYFTCIFGSASLSALAGLILKLELLQTHLQFRNDLAATMAMLAALLITLSATGDFQRKWQANRMAAAAMENLAYELVTLKPADLNTVIVEIQAINDARNRRIVGEQPSGRPRETPRSEIGAQPSSAADAPPAPPR